MAIVAPLSLSGWAPGRSHDPMCERLTETAALLAVPVPPDATCCAKRITCIYRAIALRGRMFTSYASNFDPETLQLLQGAFDAAWSEVAASPGVMVDQVAARKMIANRIIDAWRDQGERNPELLKDYAIQGLRA